MDSMLINLNGKEGLELIFLLILTNIIALIWWLYYRFAEYNENNKTENGSDNKKLQVTQNSHKQKMDTLELYKKKLEYIKFTREHLDHVLNRTFDELILNMIIFKLKKHGSLSTDTYSEIKKKYLDLVELSLSADEKELLKEIFDNFDAFKFYIIDHFSTKIAKLELLTVYGNDINDKEFRDHVLISSIFNDMSKKDYTELLNSLNKE